MSRKPEFVFSFSLPSCQRSACHGEAMARHWRGIGKDNDNSEWRRSKSSKHRCLRRSHTIVSLLHSNLLRIYLEFNRR